MGAIVLLGSSYLVEQGIGFFSDRIRARPVTRAAIRWPEYAEFLSETALIREFGRSVLGLTDARSYTTFVYSRRDHVAWVVSAARPTSFERKVWRFPIVGNVPYKGFYRERSALREAARLETEGWETLVRKVGAFSSLGYTADPLYSYMSTYAPDRIAALLLHEMTHATIWVRDDPPLSEAIATYVGDRGAIAYLGHRYGLASQAVAEATRRQTERERFAGFLRDMAARLELLYGLDKPDAWKLARRETIIADEKLRFESSYGLWFSDETYRGFSQRIVSNAYLDLYRTYNSDIGLIAAYHETIGGGIADLLASLAKLYAGGDLREGIERALR